MIRNLLWFNGWLIFVFLFVAAFVYFGYDYVLGDTLFNRPDHWLASLALETTDLDTLRSLFLSHLEIEQKTASTGWSIANTAVWVTVYVCACGAAVTLTNFIVLRRIKQATEDEL